MDEDKADKTMIRAFGWGGQTYWRNEKVEEVPEVEDVEARIAYLLEIGVEQADLAEKVRRSRKTTFGLGPALEAYNNDFRRGKFV